MAIWIYDAAEDRLCSESNGDRTTVSLSPQQHRLVAYMAARNREARGKSVLCTREELIQAVWADEPDHLPQDLPTWSTSCGHASGQGSPPRR